MPCVNIGDIQGHNNSIKKAKKRISLEIDAHTWNKAKVVCNFENMSLTKFIIDGLEKNIEFKISDYRKNFPEALPVIEKLDEAIKNKEGDN